MGLRCFHCRGRLPVPIPHLETYILGRLEFVDQLRVGWPFQKQVSFNRQIHFGPLFFVYLDQGQGTHCRIFIKTDPGCQPKGGCVV
jgi:hypothetical protein